MRPSLRTVARAVRRSRRVLSKLLDPGPDPDPTWDIPIDIGLRGAAALRARLGIDEDEYLFVAGQAWGDGRAYVLYTALDEVKKTAMYLMRLQEFLQGPRINPRTDRMSRLLVTQVVEEQNARVRRLLEVLVALILFETTNDQVYYRHLLYLEELDDLLGANADLEEFYGARSANIDDSIGNQIQWIRQLEPRLDLEHCWYLRQRHPIEDRPALRAGQILSSVRTRVKLAIPNMTPQEKLLFGFSYSAVYGYTSESVHYSINRHDFRLREGQESAAVHGLGMLILSVLDRCHRLLGRPDLPVANRVAALLERAEPKALVHATTVRDIEAGDFVLAYGDLGEVVEIQESGYGYRSYRVRYLAEKPLPEIQEDWFPAYYVQRFYTRAQFLEDLERMVGEGRLPPDIAQRMGQLSREELQPLLRESLVHTWRIGLRDWVRRQRG